MASCSHPTSKRFMWPRLGATVYGACLCRPTEASLKLVSFLHPTAPAARTVWRWTRVADCWWPTQDLDMSGYWVLRPYQKKSLPVHQVLPSPIWLLAVLIGKHCSAQTQLMETSCTPKWQLQEHFYVASNNKTVKPPQTGFFRFHDTHPK